MTNRLHLQKMKVLIDTIFMTFGWLHSFVITYPVGHSHKYSEYTSLLWICMDLTHTNALKTIHLRYGQNVYSTKLSFHIQFNLIQIPISSGHQDLRIFMLIPIFHDRWCLNFDNMV